MSDKLGVGGSAHQHGEQIGAAWASVDAARSGNRTATFAIIISVVSVLIAGLSYLATLQAMDQGRQGHLLEQRIQACTQLYNISDEMLNPAIELSAVLEGTTRGDQRELRRQVFEHFREFERNATLAMLGPASLSRAEQELQSALFAVDQATWYPPPPSGELLKEAVYAADNERREFRTACIEAVGAYREGPEPTPVRREPAEAG